MNNHFSSTETEKLTTAPIAARIAVFKISDEPTFTTTVKTVPETVPSIVPLSMLLCVDIMKEFKLTKEIDPRKIEFYNKAFPELSLKDREKLRLSWIEKYIKK